MNSTKRNVFLTGATGAMGVAITKSLVEAGHEVRGVVRSLAGAAILRDLGATPVEVDLFDATAVREALRGADAGSPRRGRTVVRKLAHENPPGPSHLDEAAVEEFVAATRAGDVTRLVAMLAPDVVLLGDGGGKAQVAGRPLAGDTIVARFIAAAASAQSEVETRVATLNGQPGLIAYVRGALDTVFLFDSTAAGITAIYVIRNPDKIRRLARSLA